VTSDEVSVTLSRRNRLRIGVATNLALNRTRFASLRLPLSRKALAGSPR
jgi:hypothetical protein